MRNLIVAGLLVLTLAGCGQSKPASESSPEPAATAASTEAPATAAASGCAAGGLDAMSALSDFQLEMDDAQKAGKLTTDELLAARDKLYNQTQAAYADSDWDTYCKAIDDMRTELGI